MKPFSTLQKLLLLSSMLISPSLAFAQTQAAPADEAYAEDEIVVLGRNIPEPMRETSEVATFMSAEDLARTGDSNAADALTYFRRQLPGETGLRNVFRGDGYFNIDLSLSKSFRVGVADHRLRFRWDVFNVTDAAKFDVAQLTNTPDLTGFGRYNGTLATCDAQAGRCMQFALRYEF